MEQAALQQQREPSVTLDAARAAPGAHRMAEENFYRLLLPFLEG